jgi:hypothetical protein
MIVEEFFAGKDLIARDMISSFSQVVIHSEYPDFGQICDTLKNSPKF